MAFQRTSLVFHLFFSPCFPRRRQSLGDAMRSFNGSGIRGKLSLYGPELGTEPPQTGHTDMKEGEQARFVQSELIHSQRLNT